MSVDLFVPAVQYVRKSSEWEGEIQEIFIPTYHIIVNSHRGLFSSDKPLNIEKMEYRGDVETPLRDIQLPLVLAQKIATVAELELKVRQTEAEVAVDLKTYWK